MVKMAMTLKPQKKDTGSIKRTKKKSNLEEKILNRTATIGVIGLGCIGLSLLNAFAEVGYPLVGHDLNPKRADMLKQRTNYLNFLDLTALFKQLDKKRFHPSDQPSVLKDADVLIISVPTTLDRYGTPDLSNLLSAFKTVAINQKKDQLVILQSSTYPGTTQEELLPLLKKKGNLKVGTDFYLAHVPEIADFGNAAFPFSSIPRIVSGVTDKCLKLAALLYKQLGCPVVPCSSTNVAEAAKLLQNAFRLVNISFINQMKIVFERMGLDIWEVIEAASSKPFGFMPFYPGPGIGGDCIPVAPFYLVWKAKLTGGSTTMLEEAGRIDASMPFYVVNKLITGLNLQKKTISGAKILILGVGYKKDVNDVRESPALKILPFIKNLKGEIYYNDPYVPEIRFPEYPELHLKSVHLDYENLHLYDAVVIITEHSCYDFAKIVANSSLVIDTRNATAGVKGAKKKVIKA